MPPWEGQKINPNHQRSDLGVNYDFYNYELSPNFQQNQVTGLYFATFLSKDSKQNPQSKYTSSLK